MAMDALVKPLLRLPLFQGLKPLQLTEIVRRAGRVIYQPGDILIEEDKAGDCAIVIVSGEAAKMHGDSEATPAEPVVEGSMIAELAMLVETVHTSTIVARTKIRALKITREDMHEQMADDTKLAEHLMNCIAKRLQMLAAEVREIDDALTALGSMDLPAPAMIGKSDSAVATQAGALH